MFAPVITVLLAFLASSFAANCNYSKCYPGNYCSPLASLQAQPQTYATPEACANQCSLVSANKFFSYVPTSKQCLCTASCSTLIGNSYADSYCLNPPSYALCKNNQQCGANTDVKTQAGNFKSPQECSEACWKANHAFNYFNYLPLYGQCGCSTTCTTNFASTGSNAFKINSATCPL
jgi:hypothetical protein